MHRYMHRHTLNITQKFRTTNQPSTTRARERVIGERQCVLEGEGEREREREM